jgi:hypothetical protein
LTGWSLGEARITLDVAVGIPVGVSRASRVSMETIVGVKKIVAVAEAGSGVGRGVAVSWVAVRLQDVNKTASMTVQ